MSNDECRIVVSLRSDYYITNDHLTFILFTKLTPKFIFVNACIPMVYKETEKIFNRLLSKKLPQTIQQLARRKLVVLDSATDLNTLRVPPGNRLEALKDDRKGQHSIRINDQWRICFKWKTGDAYDVEIADYH